MQSLVDAALQTLPLYVTLGAFFFLLLFVGLSSIAVTKVGAAISMRHYRALIRSQNQKQGVQSNPNPDASPEIETTTKELQNSPLQWAERARTAYTMRVFSGMSVVLVPALSIVFAITILRDSISILPNWLLLLSAGLISIIWPLRTRLLSERDVRSIELPLRRWLRGGFTLWILMVPHFVVALIISIVMPTDFGPLSIALVSLCLALSIGIMRMSPLPLLKALGLAKAASPRLSEIVAKSSKKAGIVPKAVYELELSWANAYAFPFSKRLAFTDELLAHLSDDEIDAVCAHELGHLGESAGVVAMRILSGIILLIPLTLVKPLTAAGRGDYVAYVFLGAFIFLMLIRRIFQRMEVHADKKAHAHEEDAGTYARALVRIYEVNVMPVVLSKGSGVHPDLYDRVEAAGAPFAWTRPKPPARSSLWIALFAALGLQIAAIVGSLVLLDLAKMGLRGSGGAAEMVVLGIRGSASSCGRLAEICEQQNRKDCALSLYSLAAQRDYDAPIYPSQAARILAESNRCEMASEALMEASERIEFMVTTQSVSEYERYGVDKAEEAVFKCYERRGIPPNAM